VARVEDVFARVGQVPGKPALYAGDHQVFHGMLARLRGSHPVVAAREPSE
jgi:hypothetical protein